MLPYDDPIYFYLYKNNTQSFNNVEYKVRELC